MKASGKVLQGADSTQRITSKVSTVSLGYLENNPSTPTQIVNRIRHSTSSAL